MSSEKLFRTEHLEQNLKNKAVRGGSFTIAAQSIQFLLRLVSTAILARLLLAEDYGLIGMTMVVSGFVGIIRDGGLNLATVQKKSITHEQTSLLFWVNVSIGITIVVVLVSISPVVAMVFREPRLTSLLCVLTIPFFMGCCTVQHRALLQRQMSFGIIGIIEVGSTLAGIIAGVTFAVANFGYWALAIMEIVKSVTALILVWFFLKWIPALPKWDRDVFSTLRFGGNVLLFNVVNYVSRNADKALIGWHWGSVSLGLYSRAYSLLMMPIIAINAPFTAVAIPILSRSSANPEKLRKIFLEAVSMVAAIVIPIVVCTSVFADDLVRIWLGEAWMNTADIFRLLSVPAFLIGASAPISWLFVVLDRTHHLRNIGFASMPIHVLSFWIGLPYGPEGVALAYTISSSAIFLPIVHYALKGTPIRMTDVFRTWKQPTLAAAFGIGAGLVVKFHVLPLQPQMVTAIASIGVFGIVYALIMVFLFGWKSRAAEFYFRKESSHKIQAPVNNRVGQ